MPDPVLKYSLALPITLDLLLIKYCQFSASAADIAPLIAVTMTTLTQNQLGLHFCGKSNWLGTCLSLLFPKFCSFQISLISSLLFPHI